MYLLEPYDDALKYILKNGIKKSDRTGVGCIGVAGIASTYRLDTDFFPIVTGRKMFPASVFAELLWILSGSTMNQDLEKLGAKFWRNWCDDNNPKYAALRERWGYEPGDFGPIYGWQLRHFGADYIQYRTFQRSARTLHEISPDENKERVEKTLDLAEKELNKGFDQLAYMIDILKNDPFGSNGRRCLFSLWNPRDLDKSSLPPCHYTYQAIPDGNHGLTGILTQRSCDFPVGVPANIQFYSALTIMLAQQAKMDPVALVHETHDSHIYLNQISQVEEYLERRKPDCPRLHINKAKDIYSYSMSDFVLSDYEHLDLIKIPVAV